MLARGRPRPLDANGPGRPGCLRQVQQHVAQLCRQRGGYRVESTDDQVVLDLLLVVGGAEDLCPGWASRRCPGQRRNHRDHGRCAGPAAQDLDGDTATTAATIATIFT
jgi:hypothetical protein